MLNPISIAATPSNLETWVWIDYRLAVIFTVILPLILLIWALVERLEAIAHLLVIYWRVASLLMITLYLMIAAIPIGFICAIASRILIPVSLWFWVDLNEEIEDMQPSPLKLTLTSWRWAITVYNAIGALIFLPSLRCAFFGAEDLLADPGCRIWLDPPWMYKQIFHPGWNPPFLGFLAIVGLLIYVGCFAYFVVIRLRRQGRSATGN